MFSASSVKLEAGRHFFFVERQGAAKLQNLGSRRSCLPFLNITVIFSKIRKELRMYLHKNKLYQPRAQVKSRSLIIHYYTRHIRSLSPWGRKLRFLLRRLLLLGHTKKKISTAKEPLVAVEVVVVVGVAGFARERLCFVS